MVKFDFITKIVPNFCQLMIKYCIFLKDFTTTLFENQTMSHPVETSLKVVFLDQDIIYNIPAHE